MVSNVNSLASIGTSPGARAPCLVSQSLPARQHLCEVPAKLRPRPDSTRGLRGTPAATGRCRIGLSKGSSQMRSRLVPFLLCAILVSPCLAQDEYDYPFTDPLEATVLGTLEIFGADLPKVIPLQEREVLIYLDRDVPDIFWYAEALTYSLSAQPEIGRAHV